VRLQVLDQAAADLLSGYAFYERQFTGVGSYFLETLFSDIESLRLYGGLHRKVFGYHRLLSRRFPYAIYYKVDGDQVSIWRVLDCRRNPSWILTQLKMRRKK
jgi:plasmid stabilization system protein ParE